MASAPRITLDELVALNDEMAALTRAGVPLAPGLRALSRDLPGRLGKLAELIGERLEQGQGLEEVLRSAGDSFPPIYVAVVAAGVRSGRLAAALEGLSTTVRRVAELRRVMIASLVYPLVLLGIASALFVTAMSRTVPAVTKAHAGLRVAIPGWYESMLAVAEVIRQWLPWVWAVLAVLIAIWLWRSASAGLLGGGGLGWFPAFRSVLRAGRLATFVDTLALMVEQNVPLDEGLVLSSAASGDARLAHGARELAERLRGGESPERTPPGIPPLLGWLLVSRRPATQLVRSLRRTGDAYHRRVAYWGSWLTLYLPIFLSAGIGGVITLGYVVLTLAPFYHLLIGLS